MRCRDDKTPSKLEWRSHKRRPINNIGTASFGPSAIDVLFYLIAFYLSRRPLSAPHLYRLLPSASSVMSDSAPTLTSEEDLRQETKSSPQLDQKSNHRFTTDFGFLPIPPRLRYDPLDPPHFGIGLNIAFGIASTFSTFSFLIGANLPI